MKRIKERRGREETTTPLKKSQASSGDLASEDQAVVARATEALERASHTLGGKHAMGPSLFHAMHQHVEDQEKCAPPISPNRSSQASRSAKGGVKGDIAPNSRIGEKEGK